MKVMMVFLSILIILAGILPFIGKDGLGIVPAAVPTTAPGYSFIIIAVGFIALIYGVMNKMMIGTEKFVTFSIGLVTILGGLLPFIKSFVPIAIPTAGPLYSGIIILIGAIGLIYGASTIG
jgi:hypothetical protein